MNFFLKKDFEALTQEINSVCDRIKEAGKEMGISCQEGAETFHDNFAHEDGERQQHMWSNRLRQLIVIRNNARVVSPNATPNCVSLGMTVVVKDEDTNELFTFKIGSYMTFGDEDPAIISYNSPLARALIRAEAGETRKAIAKGRLRTFEIVSIEPTK